MHYNPKVDDEKEFRLNKRWFSNMNRELQEKR